MSHMKESAIICPSLFNSSHFMSGVVQSCHSRILVFQRAPLKFPKRLHFSILQSRHPACQAVVNPAVLEVSGIPSGPAACHS